MKALYGTDQPPAVGREITHGDIRLTLQDGSLRHIKVGGIEVIRAIAFLARDRDWGTLVPEVGPVVETPGETLHLSWPMTFRNGPAEAVVMITVEISAEGLTMRGQGVVAGSFETNRTGFTVLHPINGVAGCPARVTHSDGRTEDSRFPDLIEPWQPFMDIAELEHDANGLRVSCRFHGDTFEMEDQRQWGDASYKTYNRPLALPWPYLIADGEAVEQAVELSWQSGAPASPVASAPAERVTLPDLALVLTAEEARRLAASPGDLDCVKPQRLLCHVDATLGDVAGQMQAFAAAQNACPDVAFDLELIGRFDGAQTPLEELTSHSKDMRVAGFRPASVFVCPSVDRQSTPPGSEWPDCPPLEDIHAASAQAFADLPRGGGMASLFTELNRKRPPVENLDFVSHGLCPIVHAADDVSVVETLEAVPHIARSARAIIGNKPYRIGPASIAMRQNPYGSRTIPNPNHERLCMTDDDPRHRGAFGAAYALGLMTALVPFGVEVWTPAALYGPRGVVGNPGPLSEVLHCLVRMAGQTVLRAEIAQNVAHLVTQTHRLRANLSAKSRDGLPPFGQVVTTG